ncbi:MAG: sigma-70 family RNA polymerase sigma factor [Myxococcota bacterium]
MAQAISAPEDPVQALLAKGERRKALELCAREHGGPVGRLCMAFLGDQGEAEEAAQETFLAAYGAFDELRGAVRPWLFAIARRRCARRLAKRSRRQHLRLVYDQDLKPKTGELPDAALARRERARAIRLCLEELRPTEREALLLRYERQLAYAEIAEILAIDENAARKRTSRALARLRQSYLQRPEGGRP